MEIVDSLLLYYIINFYQFKKKQYFNHWNMSEIFLLTFSATTKVKTRQDEMNTKSALYLIKLWGNLLKLCNKVLAIWMFKYDLYIYKKP